jgi:hypothetical protein
MQPIVNGLEAEYAGQFAFAQRNARSPEGRAEMANYQLRGHPSYAIVAPDGRLLWSGLGPVPMEVLREQLNIYATP